MDRIARGDDTIMIYLTGDKHRDDFLTYLPKFCEELKPTINDTLIVLGDAGINWYTGKKDDEFKKFLATFPITIFCVHGNHEIRPFNIPTYKEEKRFGAKAYVEEKFPNLIFAKDGEIYNIDGNEILVLGGAYSVDKEYRIPGVSWWEDEQPSPQIKKHASSNIRKHNYKVDYVVSHTLPYKYVPIETFKFYIRGVDITTEKWLDGIEDRLNYKKWYGGHYHIEKTQDKVRIMYGETTILGQTNNIL